MFQEQNTNSQPSQQVLTASNYDANQLELTDEELLHVVGGTTLELGIDVEAIEQFVRDLFG